MLPSTSGERSPCMDEHPQIDSGSGPSVYRPEGLPLNDAVPLRVQFRLLQVFEKAKRDLGHDTSSDVEQLARLRETTPTYATALVLTGSIPFPMYDDAPDFDHFYLDGSFEIALSRLTAGEVQRRVTAALIRRAQRRWRASFKAPSYVRDVFGIQDEFGRLVMIGEIRTQQRRGHRRRHFVFWRPLPPRSNAEGLKQQAAKLQAEASFERGWDNFSTAKGLDRRADETRDSASLAQYGRNLIR